MDIELSCNANSESLIRTLLEAKELLTGLARSHDVDLGALTCEIHCGTKIVELLVNSELYDACEPSDFMHASRRIGAVADFFTVHEHTIMPPCKARVMLLCDVSNIFYGEVTVPG